MTPEQRKRAARAVRDRMNDLNLTVPQVAQAAGIDQSTVRSLLAGATWPRPGTRDRINQALQWAPGELNRRADAFPELRDFPSTALLAELCRRAEEYEARTHRAG